MRKLTKRRGAAAVEGAVGFSVLFAILLGLVVGGIGVFRYFQVDCLARESARWLSVRGKSWATETGSTSPTQQQTFTQVVAPLAVGMDQSKLSFQAQWVDRVGNTVTSWDSAVKTPTVTDSDGDPVTNHVRVTVTYQWFPQFLLVGPYSLKTVTEVPMSF